MPTALTHGLIGFGASRLPAQRREGGRLFVWVAVLLPAVPDLDSLLMRWIPYGHTFGHRGFSHSLFFALLLGVAAAVLCRRSRGWFPGGALAMGLFFFLLAASHGILDALTDGGLGIAFFSPFSNRRYFMPWTPIPVSPFGVRTAEQRWWLARALGVEALLLWPLALAPVVWRSRARAPWKALIACALVAVSVVTWILRV